MRFFRYPFFLLIFCVFGCTNYKKLAQEYLYFQDADSVKQVQIFLQEYTIHTDDILSIEINSASMSQEQMVPFKKVDISSGGVSVPTYGVDPDGNIQLPLVGKIKVQGLTRKEASSLIEKELTLYLSKPSVSINVNNFSVTILGEVRTPGRVFLPKVNSTLVDALGACGDLTQFGNRQRILIMRQNEKGDAKFTRVDITKTNNFFNQDVLQLHQNDVIYVPTIDRKIKQTLSDEERTFRLYSLLLTTISFVLVIASRVTNF